MTDPPTRQKWRLRFTLRAILGLTLVVALLLGWRSSLQRAGQRLAIQANRLEYAEQELDRAREEIRELRESRGRKRRGFWKGNFEEAQLRGVTITSPDPAFQSASFRESDLTNATLQGGSAAFQRANFDQATLVGAKLTGGASSFQRASFEAADLTGAVLNGGGASFQASSFENATLVEAQLIGNFQLVNISGARFAGADLTAIEASSLGSCYFQEAPTYDARTQFPDGFDPRTQLWRFVEE